MAQPNGCSFSWGLLFIGVPWLQSAEVAPSSYCHCLGVQKAKTIVVDNETLWQDAGDALTDRHESLVTSFKLSWTHFADSRNMPQPNDNPTLRHQAFAFLERATATYGDVLPWQLLVSGFTLENQRVCLIGASGIWKPRQFPEIPISITTAPPKPGRPAPYADGIDSTGTLRYKYRGTDPAHPDNFGLRQAMLHSIPLIYFFGIEKGRYLATWPVYIVGDDPANHTFRVSVDDRIITPDTLATTTADLQREARREYVTTIAMRRLHQQSFRARVLRAYRDQCAICRLKHTELLDAAHILPDSDPRGEPVTRNGLSLCKIHHAAFDRHILGISPDLVVELRQDILDEVDGPMLRYGLQEMNGRKLVLPRRPSDRPDLGFIEERYTEFRSAG